MDPLLPTSELDAVNMMLVAVGESPVASLDENALVDAGMALTMLRAECKALQTQGWSFNQDIRVVMQPQSDGTIPVPNNLLGYTFKGVDARGSLTVRSGKVYDRRLQSFTISRPVIADLTLLLDWTDLPEDARRFVFVTSVRKFQDSTLGDNALHSFEERDEQAAWAAFVSRESENDNHNVIHDSIDVGRVTIARYRYTV